jgi:hypothetical protein
MAKIVNLNQIRKTRQKAGEDTQAARNRERHGRRKDDRQRHEKEEERRRQDLDGHQLGDDSFDGDEPA